MHGRFPTRRIALLCAGIAPVFSWAAPAQQTWPDPSEDWLGKSADAWHYSAGLGINYTTGKYGGSTSIDTTSIPLSLAVQRGQMFATLDIPYLISHGPAVVSQLGVTVQSQVGSATQQGIGDIPLSAGYSWPIASLKAALSVAGTVKFPTGDESKNLGTGEYDYGASVSMVGQLLPMVWFASTGYTVYGDPPGTSLNDVFSGSVGVGYQQGEKRTISISYFARQPITDTSSAVSQITLSWAERLSAAYSLTVYAGTGFTSASPAYLAGASIVRSF